MKSISRIAVFGVALSLAFAAPVSAFGQAADSNQDGSLKKLDKHEVTRLIASAKTPEDHRRIAEYFQEQARYYLNLSRADGQKLAAYNSTPYLDSCAMCTTTSYSLEAAVRSLRIGKRMAEQRADEMLRLAVIHARMAGFDSIDLSSLGL
jgi:hypothetical protein